MIQLYICQKQQDISHPQLCLLVIKLPVKDNKDDALALIKDWIIPAPFDFIENKEPKYVEHDVYLNSSALHVYLDAEFDEKFLVTPSERLYCAQAVSAIIRDLFVLARDKDYPLLDKLNEPENQYLIT